MKNLFLTLIFLLASIMLSPRIYSGSNILEPGIDVGHSICTDTYGNIYVTGNFDSGSITWEVLH